LAFGGQSAALVVIKPQAPLAELLAQDPVFLTKVLDDL
jgi:hypothetical protein